VSTDVRIGFAASVGDAVGKCVDRLSNLIVARIGICTVFVSDSVGERVGDLGCNFFATLGKILTGYFPLVFASVIVANVVIFLQLSVKYRRYIFRRYSRRYLCHTFTCFVCISYLSSCTNA
jgi:hypothetical protein